jgi:hypothetical protein
MDARRGSSAVREAIRLPIGTPLEVQAMADDFVENWKKLTPPLTPAERSLLEDMKGVMDFAMANDIGLRFVSSVLLHDLNAIVQAGSLEAALAGGLTPKASGFSHPAPPS